MPSFTPFNHFFTQELYKIQGKNTNTKYNQICDCNTSGYKVEYFPLKTVRRTENLSQKMKYAAFSRRTSDHSVDNSDAIQFRFRNL